ncbi:MAG: aminotransferase class V-fold PLP-dependent enzyme [Candidatus Entotheonellia bacterium]
MDLQHLRAQEFPVTREWRFFNHAATSPLSVRAATAMEQHIRAQLAHGSLAADAWTPEREETRALLARFLKADPSEIAFIRNTAEGISFVANGLRWKPGDHVVATNAEYPANMYPWLNLAEQGVSVKMVEEKDGRIFLEDIEKAIDGRTRVLAISFVEFSSGFMNDLIALGRLCREKGVLYVVDAIQGLGGFPVDVRQAHIDVLAAGGQKWLLGPRGCGVFYCSQRMLDQLKVTVVGASSVIDEENYLDYHLTLKPDATRFEYGTPNAIGIVGLRGAVELFLEVGPEPIARQILALTDRFCERVEAKGYTLFSSRRPGEKSGIVSFYKKGADSHQIAAQLQAQRFILSVRDGRLRISPHFYNTTDEIDTLLEALP